MTVSSVSYSKCWSIGQSNQIISFCVDFVFRDPRNHDHAGSTTVAVVESVPEYATEGAYLMNKDQKGRCLDFGKFDSQRYSWKHAAIARVSGPAYVNGECHGDQWQRYRFDGELIRGAHGMAVTPGRFPWSQSQLLIIHTACWSTAIIVIIH
jgi:hypothetical protein